LPAAVLNDEATVTDATSAAALTGGGTLTIPVWYNGTAWTKLGGGSGGGTVDLTPYAKIDETTLYHTVVATSAGTFSNTGTSCTGTGTVITANMIGAKIRKANGEEAIIATRTSNTSFTTVAAFATNSTGTAFTVRCISYKVSSTGQSNLYDFAGASKIAIDASGQITVGNTLWSTNNNVTINAGTVAIGNSSISGSGNIVSNTYRNSTIYTVATLPTQTQSGVYASVSDALNPTYLGTAVGGGTITCPVYWDGTNWVTH
jgi:hypothetical protein